MFSDNQFAQFAHNKMSANYWASSQRNKWQVTRKIIHDARMSIEAIEKKEFGVNIALQECKYDLNMRIYLHQMIIKLGRRLNLRQLIMSSAEIYMTRFLLKASIKEVNIYLLVATCIYVACKIEECPQHIRTILSEARRCWPEFIPNDLTKLAELEFYLIDELDCYLIVYHPYNSLTQIVNILQETHNTSLRVEITPDELQAAWSIVNDSYILDLHMMFPPHIIAVAALYLTLLLGVDLNTVEGNIHQANSVPNSSHSELIKGKSGTARSPSAFNSPNSQMSPVAHMTPRLSNNIKMHTAKRDTHAVSELGNHKSPPGAQNYRYPKKIEALINFLASSNINLQEVIQSVQEMLSLYQSWEFYDEIAERNTVHNALIVLNKNYSG